MRKRTRIYSGVLAVALTAGLLIGTPASANPPLATAAVVPVGARIVYQWNDASNTRVVVRVGTYNGATKQGFGWVKILQKHRIYSLNTIVFVTRAPGGGIKQRNGNYRYTAYANKKVCTKKSCYYTDSVPVIAIVSRSTPPSKHGIPLNGGRVGVITTYCANPNRADACPSWVDLAFAGLSTSSKSVAPASSGESTVELSYQPAVIVRSNR